MAYSFTEKKRIRKNFGTSQAVLDVPYLLTTQLDSYRQYLQEDIAPEQRDEIGLHAALKSIFPIVAHSGVAALEYVSYRLGTPVFDVRECKLRGLTYAAPLRVKTRLVIYDKESRGQDKPVKDVKEQEVYMGEMPLMTDTGSSLLTVLSALSFLSCIVRRAYSSITTRVKPTALVSCCLTLALFLTVVLGWTLSSILKMVYMYVLTVAVSCLQLFCCVLWVTTTSRCWRFSSTTIPSA
jgi:hypothetical protein